MIKLTNISKTYNRGKANEVLALQDLTLDISPNEFVVLIGSNGSGKSTLLNMISGSILPTSGHIRIDGKEATKLADYQRSQWIARVFQNPLSGTAPDLSILDNFRLAALRTTSKKLSIGINGAFVKTVQDKISTLNMGLENKLNQPMGTLSGGQRQALTLIMSVMDDLKILLLDEPTAALDPRSAETVMRTADSLIKKYDLTAILVTHNLKEAFLFGNRIIQMGEGRILKDLKAGEKQQLKQSEIYEWFL